MGRAFAEIFASVLCMQKAPLPRAEKSLLLASVHGDLGIAADARQMRRLFGPCGVTALQDVLAAADLHAISTDDDDYAAWVAHRKAKRIDEKEEAEDCGQRKEKT